MAAPVSLHSRTASNQGAGAHPARHHEADDAGDLQLARVASAFRGFMESLGLDLDEPNLAGTDRRVAKAYREMFRGLDDAAAPAISTFPNSEGYRGIVSVTGISFYSVCAHHFLPFFGTAHVGYVPDR